MSDNTILEAARKQLYVMEQFGIQARNELSDEQVKEICRMVLEKQKHIESLFDKIHSLEEQLKQTRQQRDSANGKLSALRREVKGSD